MSEDDHALTIVATGQARFDTVQDDADSMTIARSRTEEVTAEIELDADRLYDSDVATTHRAGATISASDVANVVCEELEATPVDPLEWDLTVRGSLDDWQKVCLKAAKQRRSFESSRTDTALDVLLSLHERHAETDRPIYAALNIDETYEAGRRDELFAEVAPDGDE
ncbi:hypothetical protein GWK26_12770 [haloarchaeon 3A1-DGR]|nr:hypothetical protein GWK26_12770 [haloarchaeon 3A1-DGR]